MGVSPRDFWLMEVYELNVALEEYEDERRERLSMWRMANYYTALPHMDPKKHIPTVEEFHPFPWDSEFKKKVEFIPYDQQIEFAMKVGRPDWIPDFWYENSEKYQHLALKKEDGTAGSLDGSTGTKRAAKSAKASSRKNQAK